MKHLYTFYGRNCVFSQISIENLATPTKGGDFFIREGGIGFPEVLIEQWGTKNREYHVNIKLFGYSRFDHSRKCSVKETVVETGYRG